VEEEVTFKIASSISFLGSHSFVVAQAIFCHSTKSSILLLYPLKRLNNSRFLLHSNAAQQFTHLFQVSGISHREILLNSRNPLRFRLRKEKTMSSLIIFEKSSETS